MNRPKLSNANLYLAQYGIGYAIAIKGQKEDRTKFDNLIYNFKPDRCKCRLKSGYFDGWYFIKKDYLLELLRNFYLAQIYLLGGARCGIGECGCEFTNEEAMNKLAAKWADTALLEDFEKCEFIQESIKNISVA